MLRFIILKEDDVGKLLHETTRGGADVVIDCVGIDEQVVQDDLEVSSNSIQRKYQPNCYGNRISEKIWNNPIDRCLWNCS